MLDGLVEKRNRERNRGRSPIIKSALVIFAREPKEGKGKTRLRRELHSPTVTKLYQAFVQDVLGMAARVRCGRKFIYYAGHGAAIPFLKKFGRAFALRRQTGNDLGARMRNAVVRCQREGFQNVVIIGTDCLTMTPSGVEQAFHLLKNHDAVIGPSADGGYYLVGLNQDRPDIFEGISWSTPLVLEQSILKMKQQKMACALLPEQEDIDTLAALKSFCKHKNAGLTAPRTYKILKHLDLE